MTMQFKEHPLADFISLKGMLKLDRMAQDETNRLRCIEAASRRISTEKPEDSAWLVIHVWPGREQAVEKALGDCDIEACVPICKGPKRKRRYKVLPPSDKPVFIGYTFVRCVPSEYALQGLSGFEHVRGAVGGWLRPRRLTDDVMRHFKEMAASGAYDWEVEADAIPVGSKVCVKEGPFVTFEGIVVAFGGTGKGTPVIELDIFGRKTPIMIPLAMLTRL
jgi:transcriptional antiterminator NusG